MGQQARCIDQHQLLKRKGRPRPIYQNKKKYLGKEFPIQRCPYCDKVPNVVLQDAEYQAAGHVVHQGKFYRVQIYCTSIGCPYTVYTPLEGPTFQDVTAFWNMHGRDWDKVTPQLDTELYETLLEPLCSK